MRGVIPGRWKLRAAGVLCAGLLVIGGTAAARPAAAEEFVEGCMQHEAHESITFFLIDRTDKIEDTQNLRQSLASLKEAVRPGERLLVGIIGAKGNDTKVVMDVVRPANSLWESALKKKMLDPQVLARVPLPPAARRMLADARPFADAGTETIFLTRLRWLDVPIVPQVWVLGHRVDFLLGERLVVQIDGGHHVGAQRTSDIAHDALLKLHGYHVIRVSYEQLIHQWPRLQATIMAAIAQRLHCAA